MFDLIPFGVYFEELIKTAAGLLATDGWAGLICWILLLFLILLSGWYLFIQQQVSLVLTAATELVMRARDREEFCNDLEIKQSLNAFANGKTKNFTKTPIARCRV